MQTATQETTDYDELLASTANHGYAAVPAMPDTVKDAWMRYQEVVALDTPDASPQEKAFVTRRFRALYRACQDAGLEPASTIFALTNSDPKGWKS